MVFFISFFGCIIGAIIGIAFATNVNSIADVIYELFGLRVFPRDIYYLDQIPVEISLLNIISIIFICIGLSLFFCMIPAFQASRLDAVDALNSEAISRNKKQKRTLSTKNSKVPEDGYFGAVNLDRDYEMGKRKVGVLKGVNLHIQKGEIIVIIGTSGAGKSTLLHAMGLFGYAYKWCGVSRGDELKQFFSHKASGSTKL